MKGDGRNFVRLKMINKSDATKNTHSTRGAEVKPDLPRDPRSIQGKELEAAMRRAVGRALLTHKRAGDSIAVWRDDKVVIVPAEEISVPNMLQLQLRERLSKELPSVVESLQRVFKKTPEEEPLAWAAATHGEKVRKVWEWQEPNSTIQGAAFLDSNGDLQFLFSSEEMELQGIRLRLRISSIAGELEHEREVILQPMSETEVGTIFVVPRYEWPSDGAQVSLDIQEGNHEPIR
jgi:hypothetical protein